MPNVPRAESEPNPSPRPQHQVCDTMSNLWPRSSRDEALSELRAKLLQHKEVDAKVRQLRESVASAKKEYDKTEDDLKALQSVGQIIGEVLRQLDAERCELPRFLCLDRQSALRRHLRCGSDAFVSPSILFCLWQPAGV